MKKFNLMTSASRKLNKVGLKFKKHSPEILVVGGVIGIVGSTVLACRATTKISTILEETKTTVDMIHECVSNPDMAEKYTQEDSKRDLTIIYTQTGLKLAKLYAPSVALGVVSLGCILTSHRILRKRNVALAAAYATVDRSFKDYRGRVIERFGEALDKELKYNIKLKEVENTILNEDGTESVVKETVATVDPNTIGDFSRIYYEGNIGWTKDPQANLIFLKQQQNWANEKLKAQGFLFLNDVYEMLGFDKTPYGQVVGWVYNEEDPIGDNFVDFGIYDIHDSRKIAFVNGYERNIVLDFNVDGNILEYV